MKLHGKNVTISLGLLLILAIVILIEISLFISGPKLRYDDKLAKQAQVILEKHEEGATIDRHVFAFIVYTVSDDMNAYWYNEEGDLLTQRSSSEIDINEALALVYKEYGITDASVRLGYGFKNPVYILENEDVEIYLDIDSLEQVFYRKKG